MKKILYSLFMALLVMSCKKIELNTGEEYACTVKPNANEEIIFEKRWDSKSSAYQIEQANSNLFFVRGIENGKNYLAGVDANFNTVWKNQLNYNNLKEMVVFNYNDKAFVLLADTKIYLNESNTTKRSVNTYMIYNQEGVKVSEKIIDSDNNSGVFLFVDGVKLAGLPNGSKFLFYSSLNFLPPVPMQTCIGALSFDAQSESFDYNGQIQGIGVSGASSDFVLTKNPKTTPALSNNQLLMCIGNYLYRVNIEGLFGSAPGNVQVIQTKYLIAGIYNVSLLPQYAENGDCERLYATGLNKKTDDKWTGSTIISLEGNTLNENWKQSYTPSQYSDEIYNLILHQNKLIAVGRMATYVRNNSKRFGHACIVQIDKANGNIISNATFGNLYYSSGFNGVTISGQELISVGYTNCYTLSTAENIPSWIVDIPAGDFRQWFVKVKL